MGVAGAIQQMHSPQEETRLQRRGRSQGRVEAVDRLLGRVERDLLEDRMVAQPDVWFTLEDLRRTIDVPVPADIRPGMPLGRLHALLLDWQEQIMDTEFPGRRDLIDRDD
jgi:hypothetical protein